MLRLFKCLTAVAIAASGTMIFVGCGGGSSGGGSGGSSGSGSSVLLRITMQGVSAPLWENIQGSPTPAPGCPANVPLNAQIAFTFGGSVDPATLPQAGQASGSINITASTGTSTIIAQGFFRVEDEPGLAPGNNRRVIFQPSLPGSIANPTAAGLSSGLTYTIFVPRSGNSTQVVTVAGSPISSEAITCFVGCIIPSTGSATSCFVDSTPGAPFVTTTTPASSNPSPPPVDPSSVTGNTVSILINEALDPANINTSNVRLILVGPGTQVPGTVAFTQSGLDPTLGNQSRIDYTASAPLLVAATYEIQISPVVTDFGGNPVQAQQGNPNAQRFFQTINVPFCPQPPIVEDFTSVANRASVGPPLVWDGSGQLFATFPSELIGNGSGGVVFLSAAASPHVIDTGTFAAPGFVNGVWNVVSFELESNATMILKGPWPLQIKAQGDANAVPPNLGQVIFGDNSTVIGSAPTPHNIAAPLDGPWEGGANNHAAVPFGSIVLGVFSGAAIVEGGMSGAGGGKGGRASQDSTAAMPLQRTALAEAGDGAFVNGLPGLNPTNGFYGAGEGGEGHMQVSGTIGAGGGGGGSAYGGGGDGTPLSGINRSGICGAPLPLPQVNVALSTGSVVGFIPPISEASGGSGGGGGGDRFDLVTPSIILDDQGGGGGGAGGGLRVSCVGDINIGVGVRIELNGSSGHSSITLGSGAGGSGSGGMLWLQSFAQVNIDPTANLQVNGGLCPATPTATPDYRCSGAPGLGGNGLYQFEDADGIINASFAGQPLPPPLPPLSNPLSGCSTPQSDPSPLAPSITGSGNNLAIIQFPFSGTISNTALSTWQDTQYGAPEFVNAAPGDEQFTLGTAPMASVVINYQGAPEDFNNLGTPSSNPNELSAWVPGTQLSSLSGFRFIRFRVVISYQSPPVSTSANTFPAVQQITINFNAPVGCLP